MKHIKIFTITLTIILGLLFLSTPINTDKNLSLSTKEIFKITDKKNTDINVVDRGSDKEWG